MIGIRSTGGEEGRGGRIGRTVLATERGSPIHRSMRSSPSLTMTPCQPESRTERRTSTGPLFGSTIAADSTTRSEWRSPCPPVGVHRGLSGTLVPEYAVHNLPHRRSRAPLRGRGSSIASNRVVPEVSRVTRGRAECPAGRLSGTVRRPDFTADQGGAYRDTNGYQADPPLRATVPRRGVGMETGRRRRSPPCPGVSPGRGKNVDPE